MQVQAGVSVSIKRYLKNLAWVDDELTVGWKLTIGSMVLSVIILALGLGALLILGRVESHIAGGHELKELLFDLQTYKKYLVVMTFAGVFTSLLFGYRIRKRISKPLERLSKKSVEIGKGDISSFLGVVGNDEISSLATSFNEMIKNTRKLVGRIKEVSQEVRETSQHLAAASEEMNATAEQVSSTIQDIASGAQEQKMHLESSVDELQMMAGLVDAIDNTCKVANEESSSTNEIAVKGREDALKAVERLDSAQSVVDSSAGVIYTLGEKTMKIEQILDVINGIAEQTNLLALNAAIEAARAGEHGRGFAVVAEEVRKLAEGSAKATEKIAELILGIQKEAGRAVEAMRDGTRELSEATEVVRDSMNSLKGIEEAVVHLDQRITSITEAAEELTKGIDAVTQAMDSTMMVVEKVAAGTEETAASAEEQTASMQELSSKAQSLAALADKLTHAVSKFRTEKHLEGKPPSFSVTNLKPQEPVSLPAANDGGRD
jgi:methyl-accepting chemotaxis protein